MFLHDAKRTCLRRFIDGGSITKGAEESPLKRELLIYEVAKSLKVPCENSDLQKYGRAAAKMYREEHGTEPFTCERYHEGKLLTMKCYFEHNRNLLVRAIESVAKKLPVVQNTIEKSFFPLAKKV
jgi:hypothetical protein